MGISQTKLERHQLTGGSGRRVRLRAPARGTKEAKVIAILRNWHEWAWSFGVVCTAILLAAACHWIAFSTMSRLARRKGSLFLDSVVRHGRWPSLWILPLFALLAALPLAGLPESVFTPVQRIIGLGLIAAVGWLVVVCTGIVFDMIHARYRADLHESLAARRAQTQIRLLHRMMIVLVSVVTLSVMLMTFPGIKHIGISLLASAGLVGLIVGTAMKSTLSSLIAGMQIAFTQPIRLEDAVVVEGEWGWIEEIGMTYVIVRLWDLRRLVLPLSYFLDHPFQNWTRSSADLLGSVILYVDYTVPVEELRAELRRIVESSKLWRGQVCVLQVTDVTPNALQLRALVDARDSGTAWDLRCYVREKLIEFLREKYPHTLPRVRTEFQGGVAGDGKTNPLFRAESAG